jgi:simple sugar transport system ATP-binding protein
MSATIENPPNTATPEDDNLLVVRGLKKSFGRVQALREATLSLPRRQITALIGDNGAGKSTLVRNIVGVHQPDGGEVLLDGQVVAFNNPQQGRSAGIETVFQDLALVEDLTVAQNLFLGREATRRLGPLSILDRRRMRREAADMVGTLAINVPQVTARVRRLSGGQRQAVSLARAAGFSSKLVILDEPTAALGVQETERVEQLILDLKDRGATILIISHNFEQVLRLSDQVVVMRAGRTVARRKTSDTDGQELVALVTGAIQDPIAVHDAQSPETAAHGEGTTDKENEQ